MTKALKAQMYLKVAHAGAALMVALGIAFAIDLPDFLKGLIVGMLCVFVMLLFWSKMRDEYIERLWNVGTATAFIVTLCLTLLADIIHGFASATLDTPTGTPGIGAFNVGVAALAAFYIGFHVAMLRERA